jgi:hypothetical protein
VYRDDPIPLYFQSDKISRGLERDLAIRVVTSFVTPMVAFMVLSSKAFRGRWDTMKTLLLMKTDRSAEEGLSGGLRLSSLRCGQRRELLATN